MTPENNIAKWVKAAQAGEDQAWNALYQKYYPNLYATAIHICGSSPDAKDLVQDSFVTGWLKLSQLKDSSTFGGWIKTILVRNCYQWLHKKKTNINVEHIHLQDDHFLEQELERKLDLLSMQSRLSVTLTKLPETLRSALLLRYFSSYQSYNEISEILSIPTGTVRSRLNEAKSKLIEKWNQPPGFEMDVIKESKEWNSFYYETFSGIHHHDHCKNRFFNHLHKTIQIVLPGGLPNTGSRVFENMIIDDRKVGSYLTPVNVISSGNISIIEVKHYNSPEYPDHCPPGSVMILFREKTEVNKMNLYLSWQ